MLAEIMDVLAENRPRLFLPSTCATHARFLRIRFLHIVFAAWTLYKPDTRHEYLSFSEHDYSTVTLFARFLGWSTSHALSTPTW
jgi:hypothetical protein